MRFRYAILLLSACLPAGDPAQVAYNPPQHSELRWVHLSPSNVKSAYPRALADGYLRLESVWSADSRTDSVTVLARVEMSNLVARVSRSDDGSLRGYMRVSGEGVVTSHEAGNPAQMSWPELIEWRRVPCRSLRMDRSHAID